MKGGHEWWKYVYDEYYDCVLARNTKCCPTAPPTGMDIGSTEVSLALVSTVPPTICAPSPKTVAKQYSMRYTQYRGLA